MRLSRTVVAAALAAGLGVAMVPAAYAANVPVISVPLPIPHYAHMLVDATHQHLFISGGAGSTSILVTDYAGHPVATIAGETNANGLALSGDGTTVYAALGSTDAIAAINTDSLTETARYSTGAGVDPQSLVWSAGRIWFSYWGLGGGAIGSLDPAATPAAVTLRATGDSWYSAPILAVTPAGRLVAGQPGLSPGTLASYDVSTGSATVLHAPLWMGSSCSNLSDLATTPDGADVIIACGAPYQHEAFKIADLSADGVYKSTNYPNSVAVGADGTVFAGSQNFYGDQVFVFSPGNSTALASFAVASNTFLAPAGLAVTPDDATLFAITGGPYGDTPTLQIVHNPVPREMTSTELAVTPSAPVVAGTTQTLTAMVTPAVSGIVQFLDGTTPLADPVTVTTGVVSLTTSLPVGVHALSAKFTPTNPVAVNGSASAVVSYLVYATATTTTLNAVPATAAPGKRVNLLAQVRPSGSAYRATGTIQWFDDSTPVGDPQPVNPGGIAHLKTAFTPGTHTLTAVFTPTDPLAFGPSTSASATLTVGATVGEPGE